MKYGDGWWRDTNGRMTQRWIAQAYGVSEREVYKLAAQMRETGSVEARTGNCGRKAKLTEEDLERVDKAIQAQPDITFGELIRNLELDIRANGEKIFSNQSRQTNLDNPKE